MSDSGTDVAARTYRVGLWAKTGMYMPEDNAVVLNGFPIESGEIDIVFSTHREFPDGFTAPVPFGLSVVVDGPSSSLGQAVQDFGNTVRGVTALLSLVANSAIGEPTAFIATETTVDSTSREFFTQNLETGEWPKGPGRLVGSELFPPMVDAFYNHDDQERFHRAVVQYHHALQEWEPGTEIGALNHIWIGVEALTMLIRRRLMKELGVTVHELAKQYLPNEKPREDGKYNLSKLDAEIRLRHVFQGDADTYKLAVNASNAYEHSFEHLGEVRDRAVRTAEASLGYLRSAILNYSGLAPDFRDMLLGDYFVHPHTNQVHVGLQGDLTGPAAELNQLDPFPDIRLTEEMIQFGVDELGDARVVFKNGIRADDLPHGVDFHPELPEVVALPGTVGGTELIVSGSQEELADADNRLAWEAEVRRGRTVMSITGEGLLGAPIRAQPLEVVSADSQYEYRVVHVNGEDARLGQERLTRIFVKYQSELADDGWELLCIIPSKQDESLILVCRRDVSSPDAKE